MPGLPRINQLSPEQQAVFRAKYDTIAEHRHRFTPAMRREAATFLGVSEQMVYSTLRGQTLSPHIITVLDQILRRELGLRPRWKPLTTDLEEGHDPTFATVTPPEVLRFRAASMKTYAEYELYQKRLEDAVTALTELRTQYEQFAGAANLLDSAAIADKAILQQHDIASFIGWMEFVKTRDEWPEDGDVLRLAVNRALIRATPYMASSTISEEDLRLVEARLARNPAFSKAILGLDAPAVGPRLSSTFPEHQPSLALPPLPAPAPIDPLPASPLHQELPPTIPTPTESDILSPEEEEEFRKLMDSYGKATEQEDPLDILAAFDFNKGA